MNKIHQNKWKIVLCVMLAALMLSVLAIVAFADEAPDDSTPSEGYVLYIYNADGSVGKKIDGTKSISDFCLRSAIEGARVFVDNAFLFGITTPATYVVEMYEDSIEDQSFTIDSDVTVNGNGHKIVLEEGVVLTNYGTFNDVTVEEPVAPATQVSTWDDLAAAIANADVTDIVLSSDITATGRVVVDRDLHIDLNGKTLYLTQVNNRVWKAATLTIDGNGKINVSAVDGGNVFYVGGAETGAGTNGKLVLDSIEVFGENYNTGTNAAVFMLYGPASSSLSINNCQLNLKNNRGNGSVFYDTGTNNNCKINVVDSALNFDGTVRGSVCGDITIDNTSVVIKNCDNGFNEATLTIKNGSNVTITDNTGRGLTINRNGYGIVIEDSTVVLANNGEGDIRFKASADIKITNSDLSLCNVVVDDGKNATINGTAVANGAKVESVDGVVTIKEAVTGLSGSGTETDPYIIATLEDLILFRDSVNAGETTYNAKNVYVALAANIDLAGIEWSPIGSDKNHAYVGIFNGQGKTVSNLYINNANLDCAALFGYSNGATIKNVNVKNVDIYAYSHVAAIVGHAYTGNIDNCHVSGTIKLVAQYAYSAGITADGYNNVTNCSVIADGMGEITVIEKTGAGGITGWRGEGNLKITNCIVKNLNITAWASLGGITGIIHYNNTVDGCTVENVVLNKTRVDGQASIGLVSGNWEKASSGNYTITITNNYFNNVSLNGTAIAYISALYGANYSTYVNDIKLVDEGNTYGTINDNITINVNSYTQLKNCLAASTEGVVINLTANIALEDTIILDKSVTINGNGFKLIPADASKTYNSAIMAGDSGWGDNHGETITIIDVKFEGWKTNYGAVRAQGVTLIMDGCEFTGNSVSNAAYAVLSLNYTYATITDTKFENNPSRAIDVNYNADSSKALVTIDGCLFKGNSTTGAGIIYRNAGTLVVKNSEFIGNTVNTNGNAATLYVGFGAGNEVSGCYFADNTVITSHATTKRFGSAIFCDGCIVNGNVFGSGNTATRNGESISTIVAVGAYYGAADVSANYWVDGSKPVLGVDYTVEYTRFDCTLGSYYTTYEDGVLGGLKEYKASVAKIGNVEYETLEEAIAAANNGDTITLLADVAIANSNAYAITLTKSITIDGNGFAITQADGFVNDYTIFYVQGATVTFRDITFCDLTKCAAIWAMESNVTIDGCVFKNINQYQVQGVLRFAYSSATITDCEFINNVANMIVSFNFDPPSSYVSTETLTISGCLFDGNTCADTAVIYYVKGASSNISNNVFINNKVETASHGAIIYYSEGANCVVSGNVFSANTIKAASARATILALEAGTTATGNVFSDNVLSSTASGTTYVATVLNKADADSEGVVISGNYWGGEAPDYITTKDAPTALENYYTTYEDGVLGGLVEIKSAVAKIGDVEYETLEEAIAAAGANDVIYILSDITEEIDEFTNVTFATNVAGGVTINSTYTGWLNIANLNIKSGVTLHTTKILCVDAGVNVIEGAIMTGETFYNAYDSKTIVQNGGKIVATGMIVNRYNNSSEAGIFVYGDGNDETVELSSADTIGTYSGSFYAEDATIEGKMFWIDYKKDSSEEADKYSVSDVKFIDSVVRIASEFRLYKDASLTLNGSTVTAGKVQVRQDATPAVSITNSTIKADSVENLSGASMNAVREADGTISFKLFVARNTTTGNTYFTLEEAIAAAQNGETVTLLSNVVLTNGITVSNKSITLDGNGFSISAAEGANLGYQAVYFTGNKNCEITIKNLTFKDFAQSNVTAIVFRLEGAKQFTLTNVNFDNCDVAKGADTVYSVIRVYDTNFTATNLNITNCKGGMLMDIGPSSDSFVGKIEIKDSKFEDNTVLGTALIYSTLKQAENSYLAIDNTKFINNIIGDANSASAAGRGVIHLGSDSVITNCLFDGNEVYGSHANNVSYGINEYSGYDHQFIGNTFKNNAAYQTNAKVGPVSGAAIMSVGTAVLENNVVEANNSFYHRATVDDEFTAKEVASVGTYSESYGKTTILSGTYNGKLVTYYENEGFAVKGGVFSTAVPAAFAANGFLPVVNADGTYGVATYEKVVFAGAKYNLTTTSSFTGNFYVKVPALDAGFTVNGVNKVKIGGVEYYVFTSAPAINDITSDIKFMVEFVVNGETKSVEATFTTDSYFAAVMKSYSAIENPTAAQIEDMKLVMNATRYANELYKYAKTTGGYDKYEEILNNEAYAAYLTTVTEEEVAAEVERDVANINDVFGGAGLKIQSGYSAAFTFYVKDGFTTDLVKGVTISYKSISGETVTLALSYNESTRSYDAPDMSIYDMLATLEISVTYADDSVKSGIYNLASYVAGSKSDLGYAIYAYAKASKEYKIN